MAISSFNAYNVVATQFLKEVDNENINTDNMELIASSFLRELNDDNVFKQCFLSNLIDYRKATHNHDYQTMYKVKCKIKSILLNYSIYYSDDKWLKILRPNIDADALEDILYNESYKRKASRFGWIDNIDVDVFIDNDNTKSAMLDEVDNTSFTQTYITFMEKII